MQQNACAIVENDTPIRVEPPMDPIRFSDLKKGIIVPKEYFEPWLERFDWTWHQLARNELPAPFETLEVFQNACICSDRLLWCTAFLREPEDPDHEEPYGFWDYQVESLRYPGNTVHKDAAEVGKTREIVALGLYFALTTPNGSALIGAPMSGHLEEIIEAMDEQLNWNPELGNERWHRRIKDGWKKAPYHTFYFRNGFKLDFRPSGHDGAAYRGVHARTFAFKDESAKDKNPKQWSEFWRALKPGCTARIYSTPDGDRSCEFYKLGVRASMNTPKISNLKFEISNSQTEDENIESFKDASKYVRDLKFRLFQWGKNLMPEPYWNADRKQFYAEQYGGEDSPGYKHNVLGEDGDPEHTVFPWNQLRYCIKDIPEYRCIKVLVDAANDDVIVRGYRCNYIVNDNGPVPQVENLLDTAYSLATFFDFNADNQSEFTRLIKSFFIATPGMKRGGGDLGFSDDETEIGIKSIIGKRERLVARLYLKHVTYDQQCQAVNALDDLYADQRAAPYTEGPKSLDFSNMIWGTDFGNAGSAVAHDLQGLAIYKHKHYDDRLKGFMFQSTTDNVNEDGEEIFDGKTGKPVKITLKELATDLLVKKMQRQELEYPPDPDIILYYTNHTVRTGGKQRIYKKEDDHLIDMDRAQILAKVLASDVEDLFA